MARIYKTPRKCIVRHFNNIAEMAAISVHSTSAIHNKVNPFFGNRTLAENIKYALHGATHSELKEAIDLINKVDASFRDRELTQWGPGVSGAYPIVAEYLMGLPENMRQRIAVESEQSPIKLVVEIGISEALSADAMRRRGAAIAALAMRLNEERPTALYAAYNSVSESVHTIGLIGMDSTPINLAQCVATFASAAVCRSIKFNYMAAVIKAECGHITWGHGAPGTPGRVAAIRETLGLAPQDIFIEGGYRPDQDLMLTDPVAWVHAQLDKQREVC